MSGGGDNIDSCPSHRTRRIKVVDINPHLMCVLCGGYYVDATTIIECLHSFCRSCIVRYLDTSKFCPICDVQVHKTKPLLHIRSDQTLQDVVYKLVPGLYQREMRRRREFYAKLPAEALKNSLPRSNEERGEVDDSSFSQNIFSPDEFISVALEYSAIGPGVTNGSESGSNEKSSKQNICRRYLRCPVVITVAHLRKLVRSKYGLSPDQRVDLMFSRDCLNDEFTIMDIAYMYAWKRKGPLKLYFRIFDQPNKRLKAFHAHATPFADVKRSSSVEASAKEPTRPPPTTTTTSSKKSHDTTRCPDTEQREQLSTTKESLAASVTATDVDKAEGELKGEVEVKNVTNLGSEEELLKRKIISMKDNGQLRFYETILKEDQDDEDGCKRQPDAAADDDDGDIVVEKDENEADDKEIADDTKKVDFVMIQCKKVVLPKRVDQKIDENADDKPAVCDVKTNGDFKVPTADMIGLHFREKVNGVKTNGSQKPETIREMAST